MVAYAAKLLFIPTLVTLAALGLVMFFACRGLIGLCTAAAEDEGTGAPRAPRRRPACYGTRWQLRPD